MYDSGEYQALAFTVMKHGKDCSIEDYQSNVLNKWSRLAVQLEEPYFEQVSVDSKLHMHGVLYVRKGYYKKKLQIPGYYVYVTDIYRLDTWLEYCKKSQPKDSQVKYLF